MRRAAALLPLLVALASGSADAQETAPGFVPPPQKIEKPYTNDKCLKNCHEKPGLAAGAGTGALRDLHVDAQGYVQSIHGQKGLECVDCHVDADPNFHPRAGYADVDCRACHSEAPPEGVFPPDALKRLEAKAIKPPPRESRKAEGWAKTAHAKAWSAKNTAAPFCSGCHTAHAVRQAKDPQSTVHRSSLVRTCGSCHPDQVRDYDVGGFLARFRIAGHGKGNLSNRYAVSECLSCHPAEGAHGEETITGQACPNCHRPGDRKKKGAVLSSLHIRPLAPEQPLARLLRWAYTAVVWGGAAAVGVLLLALGFSGLYRKRQDPGAEGG